MELRATAHHLGDLVAAGGGDSHSDQSAADVATGNHAAFDGRGTRGAGGVWAVDGSADDFEEDWGVEYAWSAQGGTGRHQAPSSVERMPQAICTNYLRVRRRENSPPALPGSSGGLV